MRRFLRDLISVAGVVCALSLLALFAWLTRQPDAPFFDRLASWPVVGRTVDGLRDRYRAPAPPVAGERAETPPAPKRLVWVQPGVRVRQSPSRESVVVDQTEQILHLEVVEEEGAWLRVADGGQLEGWIDLDEPRDPTPPLGMGTLPPTPVAAQSASPEILARARELMGDDAEAVQLGPYRGWADFHDPGLLHSLQRVAASAERAYRARYGLEPIGEPSETLLFFGRRKTYEAFRDSWSGLEGLDSGGHTGGGVVALYRYGRTQVELELTLAHELAHLLNRRALGPALPPWLDEGLAEDFAQRGLPQLLSPSGLENRYFLQRGDRVVFFGSPAAVERLRSALAERAVPSFGELLDLDWQAFVRSDDSSLHYATSGLLVTHLLESRGVAFHAFLEAVRDGQFPDMETLSASLGVSAQALDRSFRTSLSGL